MKPLKSIHIPAICFVFCVFYAGGIKPVDARTLTNLIADVRLNVKDTSANATLQRYTDAQITTWLAEGERMVVNLTWPLETYTTITLTANTSFYNLPSDFITASKVTYAQTGNKTISELKEISLKGLLANFPAWQQGPAGVPFQYWVSYATAAAPTAAYAQRVSFINVPNSTSTGTVTMEYYQNATAIANGTDVPFNGSNILLPYNDLLTYWATAKIELIEGDTEGGQAFMKLFSDGVAMMKENLGKLPNYNPSFTSGP